MRKTLPLLGLLLCCFLTPVLAQDSLNMTRLATWDDNTLPIANPGGLNVQYSGCWGIATGGREYAVLGGAGHVIFFDVTEPTQPQMLTMFTGSAITIWREIKSYKNRIYAVSDNTDEGLMIFDMTNAPGNIVRSYWSNEFFNAAHTITLDTTSGHIYLNGGSSGSGITILDVSQNLDQPTLIAKIPNLPGGYIHDSYVRNDTLYASSGYNGLYIYDFKTNPAEPQLLNSISTGGYNHNAWGSADGQYIYYTEEIPNGRPIQIVDLHNLTNPVLSEIELIGSGFLDVLEPVGSNGVRSIPHNVYIKDSLLFDSQYEDGLLVYNISNPTEPALVAYYDTHPENTQYNTYYGNWGNYPWLPSGTIVAGDMQNGLQLLKLGETSSNTHETNALRANLWPNPVAANGSLQVSLNAADLGSQTWNWQLSDATGRLVRQSATLTAAPTTVDLQQVKPGFYYLQIRRADGASTIRKVVVN